MFNIFETLQYYFTRELLSYNLNSEVALHFNRKLVAAVRVCQRQNYAKRSLEVLPSVGVQTRANTTEQSQLHTSHDIHSLHSISSSILLSKRGNCPSTKCTVCAATNGNQRQR